MIADADGPSGIAGVMGGADSEITDEATEVVLEAASFDRGSILRTTRRLGIRTEASNRFEKGVDPELAPVANRAAARLLIELTGATLAPAPLDVRGELAEPGWIVLRAGRVRAVTGVDVGLGRERGDPRAARLRRSSARARRCACSRRPGARST